MVDFNNMEGKSINGYVLYESLGCGGMAEVWLAKNKLGNKTAIKILLPGLCENKSITSRFYMEAKIMVDLNHRYIRRAYDYGEIDGRPCIVMEYLDGVDLKSRISDGQSFSEKNIILWWNQLVQALNYTHSKGVIHRDIKPANIFVDTEGNIKLLDFGIAKVKEGLGLSKSGQTLGTVLYMSPEQIRNSKGVDYHTDIYSLAVTFVQLLTGRLPYNCDYDSDFAIQEQIVYHSLDMSGLSPTWSSFLEPYLNKDPKKRPELRFFETQTSQPKSSHKSHNPSPQDDETKGDNTYPPNPSKERPHDISDGTIDENNDKTKPPLATMKFCGKCGWMISSRAVFCRKCGNKIS